MKKINIIKYTIGLPFIAVFLTLAITVGLLVTFLALIIEGTYMLGELRDIFWTILKPIDSFNYPSDSKVARWLSN